MNNNKRKSNIHAASPPPSKRSPMHAFSPPRMSATSPPHYTFQQQQQQQSRPLTTAAAAVAAMKRSNTPSSFHQQQQQQQQLPLQYRRQSSGTAPPSRQGSVETDREGSVAASTAAEDDTAGGKEEAGKEASAKEEAEAEDDEKDDVVVDFNANMQAQMEKAKEDMKVLLENFSDDQLQRYEGYRRSALNRTNVKRLVSQVLNQQCSQTMAFVVAGFSKVYVGEIVEKAKEIMEEWGDHGAIRPEHLREAHRRYKTDKIPNVRPTVNAIPSFRIIAQMLWLHITEIWMCDYMCYMGVFFTYMINGPIIAYGLVNLGLSIVAMGGIVVLVTGSYHHIKTLSHAIFVAVFGVIVDAFANVVVFITQKDNYQAQCVAQASTTISSNLNNASFDNRTDYYNCNSLWQNELKFSIIFLVLQFAFYCYWSLCIYSFSLVLRGFMQEPYGGEAMMAGPPPPASSIPMPPSAMINTPAAAGGNGAPFPNGDRQIIVLNNAKPASKTKRRIDTFSFKNLKRSVPATKSSQQPMQEMRSSPIDKEDALSPTPTFTHHQIKRKSTPEEDEFRCFY
ncbi:hypothetical protein [Parasitella parasitica]|uniref:Transcription initiation factor TFIID subunit 11 n=1 Tax=Parasitella parasitica TaxID=35722 RepID=A0A0B7MYW5_9FUNG|nr:hypothetical protein [Parasitella parasitica]